MKSRRFVGMILCLVLIICLFSSCGPSAAPVDTARMEELGNAFVAEMDEIIPLRENDDALLELGTLTVLDNKTYHLYTLDAFYENYRVGSEAELTVIYRTQSFVVNKFVFDGAAGYYFRYEIDPTDEKAINISAQPVDEVTIGEQSIGDLRKVVMTLRRQKTQDVTFTFENIVDEEAPEIEG